MGDKMKTKTKKILKLLMILLIMISVCIPVQAQDGGSEVDFEAWSEQQKQQEQTDKESLHSGDKPQVQSPSEPDDKVEDGFQAGKTSSDDEESFSIGGFVLDGIVYLLTLVPRALLLILGLILQGVSVGLATLGNELTTVTFADIFFNKLNITNINIFDFSGVSGPILTIRQNIAYWYYGIRNLAIVIALCVLIYVGIRMAISTLAEDKAKYKQMLVSWVTGFVLIFVLHYIIIVTINFNNALVNIFAQSASEINMDSVMTTLMAQTFNNMDPALTMGSALMYVLLAAMTIGFLITYIKRMITVCFLVVISPLITVTYSIDKIGDNKAQALNTWLKEFMFNVLIQPFHCLIYLVLVQTALGIIQNASGMGQLAAIVLAVICVVFIWKAEGIVKNIFGFGQARSLGESLASMAVVTTGMGMARDWAKGAAGGKGKKRLGKDPNKGLKTPKMKQIADADSNATTQAKPALAAAATTTSTSGQGRSTVKVKKETASMSTTQRKKSNTVRTTSTSQKQPKTIQVKAKTQEPTKITGAKKEENKSFKAPKGTARKLWNGTKAVGKAGLYAGLVLGGAMIGLSTGSASAGLAGAVTGGYIASGIGNKSRDYGRERQVKKNEEIFAGAYNKYQLENHLTNDEMLDKTEYLLNANPESIPEADREYASYVKDMERSYRSIDIDKPDDEVLDTIERIQAGEIKEPKLTEKQRLQQQRAERNARQNSTDSARTRTKGRSSGPVNQPSQNQSPKTKGTVKPVKIQSDAKNTVNKIKANKLNPGQRGSNR